MTTEVRSDNDSKLQSQALLSATKAALPDANVRVKRAKVNFVRHNSSANYTEVSPVKEHAVLAVLLNCFPISSDLSLSLSSPFLA